MSYEVHMPTTAVEGSSSAPPPTVFAPKEAPSQSQLDDRSTVAADSIVTVSHQGASIALGAAALVDSPPQAMLSVNPNDAPAEVAAVQLTQAKKSGSLSLSEASNIDASLRQAFAAAPLREQVKTLDRLADRMSLSVGRMIRNAFRHPPLIVGQSGEEYYELVNAAIDEFIPQSFGEVLLLKSIVDDEWQITTLNQVQRSLLNAAIAAGLVDRLCDRGDDAEGKSSESSEGRESQPRQWRRAVFAAVSGDEAMRSLVEEHAGTIGFDAFSAKRVLDDIRTHVFANNFISAAIRRRNGAIRQLEKMQEARYKKAIIRAEKLKLMESAEQWQSRFKSLFEFQDNASSSIPEDANQSGLGQASVDGSSELSQSQSEKSRQ